MCCILNEPESWGLPRARATSRCSFWCIHIHHHSCCDRMGMDVSPAARPRWSLQPWKPYASPSTGWHSTALPDTRLPGHPVPSPSSSQPSCVHALGLGQDKSQPSHSKLCSTTGPSILPDAGEPAIETAAQESGFNAAFVVGKKKEKKKKKEKIEKNDVASRPFTCSFLKRM